MRDQHVTSAEMIRDWNREIRKRRELAVELLTAAQSDVRKVLRSNRNDLSPTTTSLLAKIIGELEQAIAEVDR